MGEAISQAGTLLAPPGALLAAYQRLCPGGPPQVIARAPGRVNLLGGHVDMHGGAVITIAIERGIWLAAAPAPGAVSTLAAADLGETVALAHAPDHLAARLIRQRDPAVRALRDVTPAQLEAHRCALSDGQYRRARHVVSEIARVACAVQMLERGDLAAFGALMSESYRSARDDYGSSSPALDAMWAAATAQPGCWGARFSGGGEAGAVVALVDANAVSRFLTGVAAAYREGAGREGAFFAVEAGAAAAVWNPSQHRGGR